MLARLVAFLVLALLSGACTAGGEPVSSTAGAQPESSTTSPTTEEQPAGAASSSTAVKALFVEVDAPTLVDGESVDVLAGSCGPELVLHGHLVDCRFTLAGPLLADEIEGAVAFVPAADVAPSNEGPPWYSAAAVSEPCVGSGSELVCPRLRVGDPLVASATYSVDLAVGATTIADVASIGVSGVAGAAELIYSEAASGRLALFAGEPRTIGVRRGSGPGVVWGVVERWPGGEHVSQVRVLDANQAEGETSFIVEHPGSYDLVLCVGESVENCVRDATGVRVDVSEPKPLPLVDGHNGRGRIDVVVTGQGFSSDAAFLAAARQLLDPDTVPIVARWDDHRSMHFPFFTVEPLRSNADRFNVWYLDHPSDPMAFETCGQREDDLECPDDLYLQPWGYPLAVGQLRLDQPTFLHLSAGPPGWDRRGRPGGGYRAFSLLDPGWQAGLAVVPPTSDGWQLGHAVGVNVDPRQPWATSRLLHHELGHLLFGLDEEYGGPDELLDSDRQPFGTAPNCASNLADADQLWGDLIGVDDPFMAEYLDLLDRADAVPTGRGAGPSQGPADFPPITIGFHPGGACGIKPTVTSIMDGGLDPIPPVYGAANRRWMEAILALYG